MGNSGCGKTTETDAAEANVGIGIAGSVVQIQREGPSVVAIVPIAAADEGGKASFCFGPIPSAHNGLMFVNLSTNCQTSINYLYGLYHPPNNAPISANNLEAYSYCFTLNNLYSLHNLTNTLIVS